MSSTVSSLAIQNRPDELRVGMRKHLCVGPVHALKRKNSNLRGFHLSGRSLPYGPARAPTPRSMGVDKFLEHRAVDAASTASEREAAMLKAAAGSAQTLVVTVTTKPWADPYSHALRALRGAGGRNPLFLSRSQEITLISTRSQKVPLAGGVFARSPRWGGFRRIFSQCLPRILLSSLGFPCADSGGVMPRF